MNEREIDDGITIRLNYSFNLQQTHTKWEYKLE